MSVELYWSDWQCTQNFSKENLLGNCKFERLRRTQDNIRTDISETEYHLWIVSVWYSGCATIELVNIVRIIIIIVILNIIHGLSPGANYTDRATAACRQSDCQLLVSVTDPYGRILCFLDRSRYFSIKQLLSCTHEAE
jgi:hypothetical protein